MKISDFEYANPEFLYLLLVVPLIIIWYVIRNKVNMADLRLSETSALEATRKSWKVRMRHLPFVLKMLAIVLLIFVLARPQTTSSSRNVSVEGIDIVMTLDVSTSMLAEDFKPNRLEAAKDVAQRFISDRINDRIGLVIYAGEAFTQCPLTTDHDVMKNLFKDVKSGMIEDGTAIGDGLATAVNRLKDSDAISKIIILLTDGENNAGSISPEDAAEIAKLYGIRVYTIGIGSKGTAPYPYQDLWGRKQYQNVEVKIDEELMQNIAEVTDGKYYRATGNKRLEMIYEEIEKLEKSKIEVTEFSHKHEEFLPFALIALLLLALDFILRSTVLKTIP
jgi:Ca-activated chloride channel family protein